MTTNDDDGAIQIEDYANRGQNFPVLTGAAGGYGSGRVAGSLTTTAGDYTLDFYLSATCNASGNGEGRYWLRGATVTVPPPSVGDQGTVTFTLAIARPVQSSLLGGMQITATATDAAGDTSEFSACAAYDNDTIFADGFDPPPA